MVNKVNTTIATSTSDAIHKSATEFRGYARKTVEGSLEMGRIVYEAKVKLDDQSSFDQFCNQIGCTTRSSTIKKLKSIGERYQVFKAFSNHLPNNWTTLYQLSRLKVEVFEDLISNGVIHEAMTGREVESLFKRPKPVRTTGMSSKFYFRCDFDGLSKEHSKFLWDVIDVLTRMGGRVKPSETVKDLVNKFMK